MKPKVIDESDESLLKPDEEVIHQTTEATRQAIEEITKTKVFLKLL